MASTNLEPLGIRGDVQYVSYNKLQPPTKRKVNPKEWERKQRLREYRVASRREKRNRKSDEKKQRKLNATILRRMTRNPNKYNKNAGRNRERKIIGERWKIQHSAIKAVQRLAAIHDPSGKMFNVPPVTFLEDGSIITVEALNRRKEKEAKKAAARSNGEGASKSQKDGDVKDKESDNGSHFVNPERMRMLEQNATNGHASRQPMSKTQAKQAQTWEPRPPVPKPIIPSGLEFPSDEEENWLSLWDLEDLELERRTIREKRRLARGRKELRLKQKSGKAERRAGRDEKRRVYRDIKQTWKFMREEERKRRKRLQAQEDEEGKRLAVELTNMQRMQALEVAAKLGFTLENVEGVDDIKPKTVGMRGLDVDFDNLETTGDRPGDIRPKAGLPKSPYHQGRVDLSAIADEPNIQDILGPDSTERDGLNNDFVGFNFDDDLETNDTSITPRSWHNTKPARGPATDHKAITYNHRVRRKLRRAIENAQIRKELLVRQRAIEHCQSKDIPVPPELETPIRPLNKRGQRLMPNGTLETEKQERVRARVELAEFNKWAKVLRRQAKEKSIEAGIRVYLELMDRIPRSVTLDQGYDKENIGDRQGEDEGVGEMMSAANLIASWPMPEMSEGRFGEYDAGFDPDYREDENSGGLESNGNQVGTNCFVGTEESSDDSAGRQLQDEMQSVRSNSPSESSSDDDSDDEEEEDAAETDKKGGKAINGKSKVSVDDDDDSDSSEESDSDEEMEDA